MKTIKTCLEILMVVCVLVFLPEACRMNRVSNVFESIPEDARDFIINEYHCTDIDRIADLWENHQDEVLHDMRCQYEFQEAHKYDGYGED